MTRMQHGDRSDMAKIVAAVAGGFLLAGLQLFHSILDSLIIFGAIHAGVDISYSDWLGWFGYTVLFNILGGLLLVTALRLPRNKDLIFDSRRAAPGDPDAPRSTFLAGVDEPQQDSRASRPTLRRALRHPNPERVEAPQWSLSRSGEDAHSTRTHEAADDDEDDSPEDLLA